MEVGEEVRFLQASCSRSKSQSRGPEWKTILKNHLPMSPPSVGISGRKCFCRWVADMKEMDVARREGGEGLREELGGPGFTSSRQKNHSLKKNKWRRGPSNPVSGLSCLLSLIETGRQCG